MSSMHENSSNCSLYSQCWEREISRLNDTFAWTVAPVIVFMVLCIAVGTVGNIILLVSYSRKKSKTSSDYLIIVLGYVDLLACVFVHPYMTYRLTHHYLHDWGGVCKLFEFFLHTNLAVSVCLFVAIAIDRYYAVCKPLRYLRSLRLVKILSAVLVPVGIVISLPALEFIGVREEEVRSVDGGRKIQTIRCHYQHRYVDSVALSAFQCVLMIFFVITVALISVLYTRVALVARRRFRGRVYPSSAETNGGAASNVVGLQAPDRPRETNVDLQEGFRANQPQEPTTSDIQIIFVAGVNDTAEARKSNTSADCVEGDFTLEECDETSLKSLPTQKAVDDADSRVREACRDLAATNNHNEDLAEACVVDLENTASARGAAGRRNETLNVSTLGQALRLKKRGRKPPPQPGTRDQAGSPPSSALRTAKMLFVVTAAFFVSWSPYWVLVVLTSLDAGFWQPRSGGEVVLERLLTHLFYLNNSVNPIIYAVFNRQFRSDSLRLLRQCCLCCWRK